MVPLLRSSQLNHVAHGFSTRIGGVSSGRYATLNLGDLWGDDPRLVEKNLLLLAQAGEFNRDLFFHPRQVHGARVLLVDDLQPSDVASAQADALIATRPGLALGILTADCVPILLADPQGRVAAVHAGWRGTVAGIAQVAVDALVLAGAARSEIHAALGPSIGPCCFAVGEDVAEQFELISPTTVMRVPGKPRVDLRRANCLFLEKAGILSEHIDAAAPCTACDPARFFSFRRDGAEIGEMMSFIVAGAKLVDERGGAL